MKRTKTLLEPGKLLVLFLVGYCLYPTIEVHWTAIWGSLVGVEGIQYGGFVGRSSIWMAPLGGFLFVTLGLFNEINQIKRLPTITQMLLAGVFITLCELLVGIPLCVWPFRFSIWCYDNLFLHFPATNSVICFPMFVVWVLLSGIAFWLDDYLKRILYKTGAFAKKRKIPNVFHYYISVWSEFILMIKKIKRRKTNA